MKDYWVVCKGTGKLFGRFKSKSNAESCVKEIVAKEYWRKIGIYPLGKGRLK